MKLSLDQLKNTINPCDSFKLILHPDSKTTQSTHRIWNAVQSSSCSVHTQRDSRTACKFPAFALT
jgi:hypothetical protein